MKNFCKLHIYEIILYFVFFVIFIFCLCNMNPLYLLLIPIIYIGILIFEYLRYKINLKTPLNIKTPDSFDEPYHPSVVFIPKGFNGYKYFMAFTPMPVGADPKPYVDRYECPCVYASNDGIHFSDIGKNGFIDDLTPEEINERDFFSDTHLVYNSDKKALELFYRLSSHKYTEKSGDGNVCLFRKTSFDGVTWSKRELIIDTKMNIDIGSILISPSIIIHDDCYYMWFVSSYGENRNASFSKSNDCCSWTSSKKVNFSGREVDPWHIDCFFDNSKFIMIIYEFTNELSLWESEDGVTFYFKKVIMKTSKRLGMFNSGGLYRACMIFDGKYSLYFSSRYNKHCCIGLATSSDLDKFKIQNGEKDWDSKWFRKDFSRKYLYLPKKILNKVGI